MAIYNVFTLCYSLFIITVTIMTSNIVITSGWEVYNI